MNPDRPGIACHTSPDDGAHWTPGARIYRSPGPFDGWGMACGYPDVVRVDVDRYFCLFHTDFVAANSEIRGVYLREG